MPTILIRHVPRETVNLAKGLAKARGKSLQEELLELLQASVRIQADLWVKRAHRIREHLRTTGRRFSDSAPSIRADRSR